MNATSGTTGSCWDCNRQIRFSDRMLSSCVGYLTLPLLVINDRSVTALDKLSIYVPQHKRDQQPLQRLEKLAQEHDRSVNYLAVKALVEFVEREEEKDQKG